MLSLIKGQHRFIEDRHFAKYFGGKELILLRIGIL
jgi:hypothetical protein